jgi:hypothetical protein
MARINHWTDAELDLMSRHYPTATQSEMASMLPARSYSAIKQMAKTMRLRKLIRDVTVEQLDKHSRMIGSGILSKRGNIITHRMV